jgi:hypothetical protein
MTVKSLTRSSLVNNRWYENMLVGNAAYVPPGTYELIETVIVPSGGQAAVTFSNLNTSYGSIYKHLQIRGVHIGTGGSNRITFNSDTAGNYSESQLYGDGASVPSNGNANTSSIYLGAISTTDQIAFITDILDSFNTSKNKTVRTIAGGGLNGTYFRSGGWRSTAAINSITITSPGTFSQNTRISLYGMRLS